MQYTNTDPMTGIEITAEQKPDNAFTLIVRVPAYDGFEDEHALRMQIRAAVQVVLALDVMDKALSMDRAVWRSSRGIGRNIWRLVDRAPRWFDVRGVVAYPASLC